MKRLVLVSALAAAACATEPPPAAELASARAAVAQAGAGAQLAPSELSAARTKLERAQDAAARGDNRQARRLAEAAEVDARLAWAMSENERLRPSQ